MNAHFIQLVLLVISYKYCNEENCNDICNNLQLFNINSTKFPFELNIGNDSSKCYFSRIASTFSSHRHGNSSEYATEIHCCSTETELSSQFHTVNSTCQLIALKLCHTAETSFITLDCSSLVSVESSCIFSSSLYHHFFSTLGELILDNISLSSSVVDSKAVSSLICFPQQGMKQLPGSAIIFRSSFNSLNLQTYPFISSFSLASIHLKSAVFSNISTKIDNTLQKSLHKACSSSFDCCIFTTVSDALYGSVSPGMFGKSLFCKNCTFFRSGRTYSPGSRFTNAEDILFEETQFSQITSPITDVYDSTNVDNNGGALYLADCNALVQESEGGGIWLDEVSDCFSLCKVKLQGCTADWNGGGICVFNGNNPSNQCYCSALTGTIKQFSEIQCIECGKVSKKGGGIGIIGTVSHDFTLSDSLFDRCYTIDNGHGAGISIATDEITLIPPIAFYFCFFKGNTVFAEDSGTDVEIIDTMDKFLLISPFECCGSTTDGTHRVLYDNGSVNWKDEWLPRLTDKRRVAAIGGTDSEWCGIDATATPCNTLKYAVEAYTTNAVCTVNPLQGEHLAFMTSGVKIEDKRINLIGEGTTRTIIHPTQPSSLRSVFTVNKGSLSLSRMTITHDSNSGSSLVLLKDALSTFSMNDLLITGPPEIIGQPAKEFSSALFKGNTSSVLLENSDFQDLSFISGTIFDFETCALFSCSQCNFQRIRKSRGSGGCICLNRRIVSSESPIRLHSYCLTDCIFNDVILSGSDIGGGAVFVELMAGDSLIVNGTSSFEGCVASPTVDGNGRGGGMKLNVLDSSVDLRLLHPLSFGQSQPNNAYIGKNLFIGCSANVMLEDIVTITSFQFFDAAQVPTDVLLWSGSENGESETIIPLHVLLCVMPSPLHINGVGGVNHHYCGFVTSECKTLEYAINIRMPQSMINWISVDNTSSLNDEVSISSHGLALRGGSALSTVVLVVDNGSNTRNSFIQYESEAEFELISFIFYDLLKDTRETFISASFSITVSKSLIIFPENVTEVSFALIKSVGGIVEINQMYFTQPLTFTAFSPFIFTDAESASFVNSTMIRTRHKNGDGGCMKILGSSGSSPSVTIYNCSISTLCLSPNQGGFRGGGSFILLDTGASLIIKETNYSGCMVPSTDDPITGKGLGGGIYLETGNGVTGFTLKDLGFVSNDAWRGRNIFLSSWNLKSLVVTSNFDFQSSESDRNSLTTFNGYERSSSSPTFSIPLNVFLWTNFTTTGFVDETDGSDFSGCGFAEAKCASVNHLMHTRFDTPPADQCNILISSSSSVNEAFTFETSQSFELQANAEDTPVVVSDTVTKAQDGFFVFTIPSNVENISFLLPSDLNDSRSILFSCEAASFTMNKCSMKLQEHLFTCSYSLLYCRQGDITLSDIAIVSMTFASTAVFALEQSISSFSVSHLLANDVFLQSNAAISILALASPLYNVPTVSLITCGFNNMRQTANNPCLIASEPFVATKCTLQDSYVIYADSQLSEKGGGMYYCMSSDGQLSFINCTFYGSRCSPSIGRGGGIYLDCINPTSPNPNPFPELDFSLKKVRFDGNEAFIANDLFINCHSYTTQATWEHFDLDWSQESINSGNSFYVTDHSVTDFNLIPFVEGYRDSLIYTASSANSVATRLCGRLEEPCATLNMASTRLLFRTPGTVKINQTTNVTGLFTLSDIAIESIDANKASVLFSSFIDLPEYVMTIPSSPPPDYGEVGIVTVINDVSINKCTFNFVLERSITLFSAKHETIFRQKNGTLMISECVFSAKYQTEASTSLINSSMIVVDANAKLSLSIVEISHIYTSCPLILLHSGDTTCNSMSSSSSLSLTASSKHNESKNYHKNEASYDHSFTQCTFSSIKRTSEGPCAISCEERVSALFSFCTFDHLVSSTIKGTAVSFGTNSSVLMESSLFNGQLANTLNENAQSTANAADEMCFWGDSIVHFEACSAQLKNCTFTNSTHGGISVTNGTLTITNGRFERNNPQITNYPSFRRNIHCEGRNGVINLNSLRLGDGKEELSSLWIDSSECTLNGLPETRASHLFMPTVTSVENTTHGSTMDLTVIGTLLMPCDLSLQLVFIANKTEPSEQNHKSSFDNTGIDNADTLSHISFEGHRTKEIESTKNYRFHTFVNETHAYASIPTSIITMLPRTTEVRLELLYKGKSISGGDTNSPASYLLVKSSIIAKADDKENLTNMATIIGAIVGGILSVLLSVLLIVIIVVLISRRRKKAYNKKEQELTEEGAEGGEMTVAEAERLRRAKEELRKRHPQRNETEMQRKLNKHQSTLALMSAEDNEDDDAYSYSSEENSKSQNSLRGNLCSSEAGLICSGSSKAMGLRSPNIDTDIQSQTSGNHESSSCLRNDISEDDESIMANGYDEDFLTEDGLEEDYAPHPYNDLITKEDLERFCGSGVVKAGADDSGADAPDEEFGIVIVVGLDEQPHKVIKRISEMTEDEKDEWTELYESMKMRNEVERRNAVRSSETAESREERREHALMIAKRRRRRSMKRNGQYEDSINSSGSLSHRSNSRDEDSDDDDNMNDYDSDIDILSALSDDSESELLNCDSDDPLDPDFLSEDGAEEGNTYVIDGEEIQLENDLLDEFGSFDNNSEDGDSDSDSDSSNKSGTRAMNGTSHAKNHYNFGIESDDQMGIAIVLRSDGTRKGVAKQVGDMSSEERRNWRKIYAQMMKKEEARSHRMIIRMTEDPEDRAERRARAVLVMADKKKKRMNGMARIASTGELEMKNGKEMDQIDELMDDDDFLTEDIEAYMGLDNTQDQINEDREISSLLKRNESLSNPDKQFGMVALIGSDGKKKWVQKKAKDMNDEEKRLWHIKMTEFRKRERRKRRYALRMKETTEARQDRRTRTLLKQRKYRCRINRMKLREEKEQIREARRAAGQLSTGEHRRRRHHHHHANRANGDGYGGDDDDDDVLSEDEEADLLIDLVDDESSSSDFSEDDADASGVMMSKEEKRQLRKKRLIEMTEEEKKEWRKQRLERRKKRMLRRRARRRAGETEEERLARRARAMKKLEELNRRDAERREAALRRRERKRRQTEKWLRSTRRREEKKREEEERRRREKREALMKQGEQMRAEQMMKDELKEQRRREAEEKLLQDKKKEQLKKEREEKRRRQRIEEDSKLTLSRKEEEEKRKQEKKRVQEEIQRKRELFEREQRKKRRQQWKQFESQTKLPKREKR